MTCQNTLPQLDLYLDNQLDADDATLLRHHLEGCPSCRQELQFRRQFRNRLKDAVSSPPAPYLETRVLARVRSEAAVGKSVWFGLRRQIAGAAAVIVISVGAGGVAYHLDQLRIQDHAIQAASQQISSLMRVGFGDHMHCAVFGKVPRKLVKLEAVDNELPTAYKPLLKAVGEKLPAGYLLYTAHTCRYAGRTFQHLAMKKDDRIVSVIVTRRQDGERFDAKEVRGLLAQGGLPIYTNTAAQYQIAGLETADHLAYVVSDLTQGENSALMLALAPAVSGYLTSRPS